MPHRGNLSLQSTQISSPLAMPLIVLGVYGTLPRPLLHATLTTHHSPLTTSRSHRLHRLSGLGDGEDVVGAGHVGEAAEVEGIGEPGLAGGELLVAAGGDGEGV